MTDPRELIDELFDRPDQNEWTDAEAARILDKAVRAVLDLHQPINQWNGRGVHRIGCRPCDKIWPCPTVQAVTDALESK